MFAYTIYIIMTTLHMISMSVTIWSYIVLYHFIINVNFDQVKMLMVSNVQTTTFINKKTRYRANSYSIT